ncbi:hypothetical protein BRADI_1g41221v3 [Brachypodium distachyon]|nr:hypothetical protein BRADI_1g41221v3 [Brachypodium distachyon]KQK18297.1 hypothetical protein BRADI_1g41221v3 [Brachypodium distachyon]
MGCVDGGGGSAAGACRGFGSRPAPFLSSMPSGGAWRVARIAASLGGAGTCGWGRSSRRRLRGVAHERRRWAWCGGAAFIDDDRCLSGEQLGKLEREAYHELAERMAFFSTAPATSPLPNRPSPRRPGPLRVGIRPWASAWGITSSGTQLAGVRPATELRDPFAGGVLSTAASSTPRLVLPCETRSREACSSPRRPPRPPLLLALPLVPPGNGAVVSDQHR